VVISWILNSIKVYFAKCKRGVFMAKFLAIFLFFLTLLGIQPVSAWDDSPPCFRQLELNFFREKYVREALSFHENISQGIWTPIVTALRAKSKEIPGIVKEKARRMERDPLDHPFQPEPAAQLLRNTLYEEFTKVLYNFQITNTWIIQDMFRYITHKYADEIQRCFGNTQAFE
jgi:hypothetical protein